MFKAKWRANRTDKEWASDNKKRRDRQANLSEEEKKLAREKDKKRKAEKRLEEKAERQKQGVSRRVYNKGGDPNYYTKYKVKMRSYMKNRRREMSKAEKEYDNVDNLIKMRQARHDRDGKQHLLDNLKAKKGMRILKECGRVIGRDFMRRAKREKDEEALWWTYWNSGKTFKEHLQAKRPETAKRMKEKEDLLKKKVEDRKKLEEKLDAEGRWKLESDGEYYWSIPDDNGHRKSLAEYEDECEANEPKLSPEEEEEKRKKEEKRREEDREMWRKHDEQMDRWYEQERQEKNAELARKQRERRAQKKAELLKPIKLPKEKEKGEYERARDTAILERHDAMKASGMFSDKELKAMLTMIT